MDITQTEPGQGMAAPLWDERREGANQPLISIVIKCYNEQERIASCIESALAVTRGLDAEIIVADALSTDKTVDIASLYPVRIVQMAHPSDRGCAATAQMGQQSVRGEFVLLVDGDMELLPNFLAAALAELRNDPKLAGVGGRHVEMSTGMEYREREQRGSPPSNRQFTFRLPGSALYRNAAIRDLGYFMDRNLYCGEEFEFCLRLRSRGWRLKYLPIDAARHYGYELPAMTLLRKRWKSRYLDGYGQLLRGSWLRPHFFVILRACAIPLAVVAWWTALAGIIAMALAEVTLYGVSNIILFTIAALLPAIVIVFRKRSLSRTAYTLLSLQFHAAALLRGLIRPQRDPTEPVKSTIVA